MSLIIFIMRFPGYITKWKSNFKDSERSTNVWRLNILLTNIYEIHWERFRKTGIVFFFGNEHKQTHNRILLNNYDFYIVNMYACNWKLKPVLTKNVNQNAVNSFRFFFNISIIYYSDARVINYRQIYMDQDLNWFWIINQNAFLIV